MYYVCFMDSKNRKGIVGEGLNPATFSFEEAWKLIENTMASNDGRIKFMWVREAPNANSDS